VEKKKYDLCMIVLHRLQDAGILEEVVLVGSWCMLFYETHFESIAYHSPIHTRDIDFVVPHPGQLRHSVDIPELLKDLGFIIGFAGEQGYIKLQHPELIVAFLVPEHGRGREVPYPLPKLGLNAEPLRFLDLLCANTITCDRDGLILRAPHPACFALHKLLICHRRRNKEKAEKDQQTAVYVLRRLIENNEWAVVLSVFGGLRLGWKKTIAVVLREIGETELADRLTLETIQ
jgi:hypothetical protein